MPTLYILAEPNGAGKTTFYQTAIEEGFISKELPFINVDLITKDELGSYSEINFARAEELYRERVGILISQGQDFMIESNLAKDSEYNWVEKMKQKGYEVVVYYLCTDYPEEVHVKRVQGRVLEGGHNVPENIIHHRYKMSLLYLKTRLHIFDKAYLIDNQETAIVMAELVNGSVTSREDNLPQWVIQSLSIIEKLKKSNS
jgi:predicted ABC-type ATPase